MDTPLSQSLNAIESDEYFFNSPTSSKESAPTPTIFSPSASFKQIPLDSKASVVEPALISAEASATYYTSADQQGASSSPGEKKSAPSGKKESVIYGIFLGIICFFISISSTLGTGILALPVKAGASGFEPFLIIIIICTVARMLEVVFMTELLQRTQALLKRNSENPKKFLALKSEEMKQAQQPLVDSFEKEENVESTTETPYTSAVGNTPVSAAPAEEESAASKPNDDDEESKAIIHDQMPDLHTMGKLFLHPVFRFIFEITIIANMMAILISYSIAGPTAFAQLIGYKTEFIYVIAPFVIILTFIVLVGDKIIHYILALLTFGKGGLIITMVIIAAVFGFMINNNPTADWQYIGRPFVVSTIAMGGLVNILPLIYSKMIPTRRNVIIFLISCLSALIACAVLITLWVFFILKSVPQTSSDPSMPSLSRALKNGEISTVPLIEIINARFAQNKNLTILFDIFVVISIIVSFIAVASSLKHYLDGIVKSYVEYNADPNSILAKINRKLKFIERPDILFRLSLYLFFFSIVYLVAQLNPQQFFVILEFVAGISLNIEAGIFLSVMLALSRLAKHKVSIPVQLPAIFLYSVVVVIIFYLFAIVVDITYTIANFTMEDVPF